MRRLAILASVVAVAVVSANCSNSREGGSSGSIMAPSVVDSSALVGTMAKGGGGKPGGGGTTGGSSSLSVVMLNDNNANGLPDWNDTITFNVSTTATTTPYVDLACYKNGINVLAATAGFFDSYPWPASKIMTLFTAAWSTDSAADCTASLYYPSGKSRVTLATLSFTAY